MVSAAVGAKILIDRNYQNLYLVAAPMARAFKIGTDGQLTEYGEPLGIGAVQTFAALTRDAKYIITVENSANAAIRAISTNDTGLLLAGGSAGLTGVGSGVFDIVLDPQQKHLFVKTLTSSVIPVSLSFGESILFTQRPALTLVTNGYDAPISTHLDFVPVFEQN